MKKIPTLFKRGDDHRVIPEASGPIAQRILDEPTFGLPTRKYDGTAVLIDTSLLDASKTVWKRYTLRQGKSPPPTFTPTGDPAPVTGKQAGWVRIDLGEKYLQEALEAQGGLGAWRSGSYELCGPKVNENPEGFERHCLIRHGSRVQVPAPPRNFVGLHTYLSRTPIEGIVWWHNDEPIVKIKTKDFGIPRFVGNMDDNG